MTVWAMLEECVGQLTEPFRRSEIVSWFRRHHPEVNEATLGAHIQAATANATNRARNNALGARAPLLRRIDHGLYVRAAQPQKPPAQPQADTSPQATTAHEHAPDLILIGCVRTKRATACAAAELFASPLFQGRRGYAAGRGVPWYILSAKFGLLAPDDVIGPYDMYLADQSPAYRKAWGEFVAAQLEQQQDLHGRTVEIHAGTAYADPLRAPLAARGAALVTPLAHLRQGEQLAWYNSRLVPGKFLPPSDPSTTELGNSVADLVQLLSEPDRALTPQDLKARGPEGLQVPGLYSWWADEQGAADLSSGLGHPVSPGLIYAGQAGATRWPSGQRSASTLWSRITSMHLGGAAEFSTFRRTLAAILTPVLGMTSEDDPQLSAWMNAHLRVIAAPVPDADRLGQTEAAVLDRPDPPLNLQGRPPSPTRTRLAELRRHRSRNPATGTSSRPSPPPKEPPVNQDQTERQFHRAMVAIYETAKRDLGYNATRFLQMISEQGGLATARQLLRSDKPSDGFTTLCSITASVSPSKPTSSSRNTRPCSPRPTGNRHEGAWNSTDGMKAPMTRPDLRWGSQPGFCISLRERRRFSRPTASERASVGLSVLSGLT